MGDVMKYSEMSQAELKNAYETAKNAYRALCARGLSLDLSRGKPAADQLAISTPMLDDAAFLSEAIDIFNAKITTTDATVDVTKEIM